MHIEVVNESEDKLSSIMFRFWISTEYRPQIQLILDIYAERSRRTKRCKWVNDKLYSRLNSRNSDLLAQEVRIPESVEDELKKKLKAMIDETTIKMELR
jgi:hypothetical protein